MYGGVIISRKYLKSGLQFGNFNPNLLLQGVLHIREQMAIDLKFYLKNPVRLFVNFCSDKTSFSNDPFVTLSHAKDEDVG